MLDAFIIEQIQREKEREEWKPAPLSIEVPFPPEVPEEDPRQKEADKKKPVVLEF